MGLFAAAAASLLYIHQDLPQFTIEQMLKFAQLTNQYQADIWLPRFEQVSRKTTWPFITQHVQCERGSTARRHNPTIVKLLGRSPLHDVVPPPVESLAAARTSDTLEIGASINKYRSVGDAGDDFVHLWCELLERALCLNWWYCGRLT